MDLASLNFKLILIFPDTQNLRIQFFPIPMYTNQTISFILLFYVYSQISGFDFILNHFYMLGHLLLQCVLSVIL